MPAPVGRSRSRPRLRSGCVLQSASPGRRPSAGTWSSRSRRGRRRRGNSPRRMSMLRSSTATISSPLSSSNIFVTLYLDVDVFVFAGDTTSRSRRFGRRFFGFAHCFGFSSLGHSFSAPAVRPDDVSLEEHDDEDRQDDGDDARGGQRRPLHGDVTDELVVDGHRDGHRREGPS